MRVPRRTPRAARRPCPQAGSDAAAPARTHAGSQGDLGRGEPRGGLGVVGLPESPDSRGSADGRKGSTKGFVSTGQMHAEQEIKGKPTPEKEGERDGDGEGNTHTERQRQRQRQRKEHTHTHTERERER